MKVLVTGSSGLVGTALVRGLLGDGHTVLRLVRVGSGRKKESSEPGAEGKQIACTSKAGSLAGQAARVVDVLWNPATSSLEGAPFGDAAEIVEGADAVVNLAGASIADQSWTKERKALLRSSRVHTTRALVSAFEKMRVRSRILVSASAIGYYGDAGDELLTEQSAPGSDFLAAVAQEWEAEAIKAEALGLRVIRARFGIILANHGGALPQMMRPFRFGAGGRMGSGKQWMSWVTLADAIGILRYALESDSLSGAINVVSPQPVRNAEFARKLARAMNRPAIFPAPAFALRLALGEMADALLLASQRVVPSRLEHLGYKFEHADLGAALAELLS